MKRIVAVAGALLLVCQAHTGTKVTEKYEKWQLTTPPGPNVKVAGPFDSKQLCIDAAKVMGAGKGYKCKDVTNLDIEATCEDVPIPAMKTLINAEGFMEQPGLVVQQLPNSTEWGPTMQEGFVKGPDWALGKNCWIPGLVPYKGTVPAPDGPNDMTPSPFVYGVDPEWKIGKPCPVQVDGKDDPHMCYHAPNQTPPTAAVTP